MARTGIVKDQRYLNHDMGLGHPESPERLRVLYQMLEEEELRGQLLENVKARPATREEIELNHDPSYIDLIASTAGKPHYRLDLDTSTSAGSYEAALLAAGGLLELIQEVMSDRLKNGFALVRPPGHHAERNRAMGFCLFNNVAIGAKFAMKQFSLDRVLIVDWDVHHGNGTQHSFYDEPKVLYFSTHRYPFFYPGTGGAREVGKGEGEGFTVNVPLPSGCGDSDYADAFNLILKPIALEYRPQLVLVSAGFDIHYADPLGGMEVTEKGFARMTQILMELADATAQGRIVLVLEGGYDVAGQSRSVKAVLKQLVGASQNDDRSNDQETTPSRIEGILEEVRTIQKRYWKNL